MADTVIKRHPIRGLLYGILFGLGLMLLAVGQGWAALGTTPPILLFVAGLVVGTLWGTFGPAKKPKGSPPPEPVEVEQRPAPTDSTSERDADDSADAATDASADAAADDSADAAADASADAATDDSDDDTPAPG